MKQTKNRICNLGGSLLDLQPHLYGKLDQQFQISSDHDDLAKLASPKHHLFIFCWQADNDRLMQQAISICHHLRKKIIVLHEKEKPAVTEINSNAAFFLCSEREKIFEHLVMTLRLCYSSQASVSYTSNNTIDLEHIPEIIKQNLDKSLREDQLAAILGYSTSHFSRLFYRTFGTHYRTFVLSARLDRAKQLLKQNKQQSVSNIATRCGFNDASYFCKVFKRETGVSPLSFRQTN
ncbi:transcriptional regulator AraC family [Vibrio ponticus]|nr:transcriptional regulator AraC family [Vibrio ponticus]